MSITGSLKGSELIVYKLKDGLNEGLAQSAYIIGTAFGLSPAILMFILVTGLMALVVIILDRKPKEKK